MRRAVTTGFGEKGMIEIISGIDDDEHVVTVGQASLKQDSKVTVINQTAAEKLAAETIEPDATREGTDSAPTD